MISLWKKNAPPTSNARALRRPGGETARAVIVDIIVVDTADKERSAIEIRTPNMRMRGEFLRSLKSVVIGDEIHIRVPSNEADDLSLIVLGEVMGSSSTPPNRIRLQRGNSFPMVIQRVTLRGRDIARTSILDETFIKRTLGIETPSPGVSAADAAALDEEHFVDDDADATEVLLPISFSSSTRDSTPKGRSPRARTMVKSIKSRADIDADIAFSFDDDDTIVEPDIEHGQTLFLGDKSLEKLDKKSLEKPLEESVHNDRPRVRTQAKPQQKKRSKTHSNPRATSSRSTTNRNEQPHSRRSAKVPDGLDELTGVVGRLETMRVVEVVQSLEVLRRTARVDFVTPDGKGALFIELGQVVHAMCSDLDGKDAFVSLLQFERGSFRIRFGRTAKRKSIDAPTNFFLLDCMRIVDEIGAQRQRSADTAVGPAPQVVRDRAATERSRRRARMRESNPNFRLAPPR